jgi:hypothetical protein
LSASLAIPPDYDTLDAALDAAGVPLNAAEAHGIMTGLLCTPPPHGMSGPQLVLHQAEHTDPEGAAYTESLLTALSDQTQTQLHDPEFGFEPLLPDTTGDAAAGADALAAWCRGFLFGLVAGGVKDFARLPAEAGEFVQDLMQIAEAEAAPGANEEEDARALAELVEYLRAGVQLMYEELQHAPH